MKIVSSAVFCSFVLWMCAAAAPAAQTNYVLGAQDVVTVVVFGEPDLSRKYTIEQDGTFTFPLIGRVVARGMTLRALEAELTKKLSGDYLKDPQVSVSVEAYRSQKILVMGQVGQPGEYQLTGDMTLLAALAKAGSVTPMAGREVLVVRAARKPGTSNGEAPSASEVLRVDLAELQGGNMTLNLALQDGDTINVPEAQSIFITGQVKSPGGYAVKRGMTVLQALALAGGVTDRGSTGRIQILRTLNGKQKEMKGKLTDVVEPGDTIVVRERIF
jgi:polysaccharide export outer membrane protein